MYVAYAVMKQTHHLIRGSAMDSLVPYACYKSTSEPKSHGSKPRDITCNKEHRSDRSRRELLLPAHLFDRIRFPKEKCVRAWGGCQALSISNLLRVPAKNYLQGYRIHIASYSNTRDSMKKKNAARFERLPDSNNPTAGGPDSRRTHTCDLARDGGARDEQYKRMERVPRTRARLVSRAPTDGRVLSKGKSRNSGPKVPPPRWLKIWVAARLATLPTGSLAIVTRGKPLPYR